MTQEQALNIMKMGHNIFLTGSAGTGKTFVLNQFIDYMKRAEIDFAITASTGIAATHIGGTTIHSWSGIGIKDKITEFDLDLMRQKEKLYKRYNKTRVLVIDEVSMLHASRIDMLDRIAKSIRGNDKPFGGMQIIFCGDFCQLPPVVRDKNIDLMKEFAFMSPAWRNANPVICYLTENYRQEDNTLLNILNGIRMADEDIYESLEAIQNTIDNKLDNAIKLYTHNVDVDDINRQEYNNLHIDLTDDERENKEENIYEMIGVGKKDLVESLKSSILTDEYLKLKIDTKVLFIKNNIEGKYQNGTLGVVIGFENDLPKVLLNNGEELVVERETWEIKDDNDKIIASVAQIPLRYAWAITIHKSQGMTLDNAEIDLSKGFGFGMGYVALSRVRSLDGMRVIGLNNQAIMMSPFIIEQDHRFRDKSDMAVNALEKYTQEDLNKIHSACRVAMGGLEKILTKEQIEEIEEEQRQKELEDKIPTTIKTLNLLLKGKSIFEIKKERELTWQTIIGHLTDLLKSHNNIEEKEIIRNSLLNHIEDFIKENKLKEKDLIKIKKLFQQELDKEGKLSPVLSKYKPKYKDLDFDIIKIIIGL